MRARTDSRVFSLAGLAKMPVLLGLTMVLIATFVPVLPASAAKAKAVATNQTVILTDKKPYAKVTLRSYDPIKVVIKTPVLPGYEWHVVTSEAVPVQGKSSADFEAEITIPKNTGWWVPFDKKMHTDIRGHSTYVYYQYSRKLQPGEAGGQTTKKFTVEILLGQFDCDKPSSYKSPEGNRQWANTQ